MEENTRAQGVKDAIYASIDILHNEGMYDAITEIANDIIMMLYDNEQFQEVDTIYTTLRSYLERVGGLSSQE